VCTSVTQHITQNHSKFSACGKHCTASASLVILHLQQENIIWAKYTEKKTEVAEFDPVWMEIYFIQLENISLTNNSSNIDATY